MFFLGQLEHGLYEDCQGVRPNLLDRFYGVDGGPIQRLPHQSGAGHSVDEEDSDYSDEECCEPWNGISRSASQAEEGDFEEWHGVDGEEGFEEWFGIDGDEDSDLSGFEDFPNYAALVNSINSEGDNEFNQEAIEAPKHADPFQDKNLYNIFQRSLAQLQRTGAIPLGYGIHPTEWDDTGYPSFGTIRTGLSGRKELRIALPDSTWRRRSVQWVQGLYLMNQLIDGQSSQIL